MKRKRKDFEFEVQSGMQSKKETKPQMHYKNGYINSQQQLPILGLHCFFCVPKVHLPSKLLYAVSSYFK
jgi:hypothetical protein